MLFHKVLLVLILLNIPQAKQKIDNTTSEVEDLIYLKDKNLLLINGGIGFVVDSGTQPAQELIVN